MSGPTLAPTSIPGLLRIGLEVHQDGRGWFKESYQRAKLETVGLPRFDVVQHNVSYNAEAGVTRGIHAEPWGKFVSPAHGRVFAAVVDLRAGAGFAAVETFELTPYDALFVPFGCGNSFCTLEPHTVYSYLVDDHWSAQEPYVMVDLFDPTLAIAWPLPRERMLVSDRDARHPPLGSVTPFPGTQ